MAHVSLGVVHRSLRRPPTALSGLCRLSCLVWSVLILDRTLAPTTLYTLCVALTPHGAVCIHATRPCTRPEVTCCLSILRLSFKGREDEDCPVRVQPGRWSATSVRLHSYM